VIGLQTPVDAILLTMLAFTAIAISRQRNLLSAAMLLGIFSLLGACWMLFLDAPDVAFTEAAVGAGISTILLLATLSVTTTEEKNVTRSYLGLTVVTLTGSVLAYATFDMPRAGDPESPANRSEITRIYLHSATPPDGGAGHEARAPTAADTLDLERFEVGIPNTVTTVLASFRGYDTLGEACVIFTAGFGVVAILRGARHRRYRPSEEIDLPTNRTEPLPPGGNRPRPASGQPD
jgi:multicomponent Na+:H+ antiporter subunit B